MWSNQQFPDTENGDDGNKEYPECTSCNYASY